jgi:hypothetical protein
MDPQAYTKIALENFAFQSPGAFYGSATGRSPGVGLIYGGVTFPLFNYETNLFDTVQGAAYVLTHECDVDQSNNRHFNDLLVVCPIIPLETFVVAFESEFGELRARTLVTSLAKNDVSRVFFLPPPGGDELSHGALLYLNQLCSTPVAMFKDGAAYAICALSTYGLARLDGKLQNHFFRPKEEPLPEVT